MTTIDDTVPEPIDTEYTPSTSNQSRLVLRQSRQARRNRRPSSATSIASSSSSASSALSNDIPPSDSSSHHSRTKGDERRARFPQPNPRRHYPRARSSSLLRIGPPSPPIRRIIPPPISPPITRSSSLASLPSPSGPVVNSFRGLCNSILNNVCRENANRDRSHEEEKKNDRENRRIELESRRKAEQKRSQNELIRRQEEQIKKRIADQKRSLQRLQEDRLFDQRKIERLNQSQKKMDRKQQNFPPHHHNAPSPSQLSNPIPSYHQPSPTSSSASTPSPLIQEWKNMQSQVWSRKITPAILENRLTETTQTKTISSSSSQSPFPIAETRSASHFIPKRKIKTDRNEKPLFMHISHDESEMKIPSNSRPVQQLICLLDDNDDDHHHNIPPPAKKRRIDNHVYDDSDSDSDSVGARKPIRRHPPTAPAMSLNEILQSHDQTHYEKSYGAHHHEKRKDSTLVRGETVKSAPIPKPHISRIPRRVIPSSPIATSTITNTDILSPVDFFYNRIRSPPSNRSPMCPAPIPYPSTNTTSSSSSFNCSSPPSLYHPTSHFDSPPPPPVSPSPPPSYDNYPSPPFSPPINRRYRRQMINSHINSSSSVPPPRSPSKSGLDEEEDNLPVFDADRIWKRVEYKENRKSKHRNEVREREQRKANEEAQRIIDKAREKKKSRHQKRVRNV